MALFLLLKSQNLSSNRWEDSNQVFSSCKKDWLNKIAMLGGVFSKDETPPSKKSCVFFTGFDEKKVDFYNPGSSFSALVSRCKDTIDNSVADLLLFKQQEKIKLQDSYIEALIGSYNKKYNLLALACWALRFYNFDSEKSPSEIKKLFCDLFKISDVERQLFDGSNNEFSVKFSKKSITGSEIRNLLGISDEVDIQKNNETTQNNVFFRMSESIKDMSADFIKHPNAIDKYLHNILDNYKQIILTGPPGVGKTHSINLFRNEFDISIVQFHQNYTYQDFVVGRIIQNDIIKSKKGHLLRTIDRAKANPSKKFLLVLDEINRGNIGSIFGELMLLLDRGESQITLATSSDDNGDDIFESVSLPDNLYIIGTMNTSDRSIAVVDFALRRRFAFVNLQPNYELLNNKVLVGDAKFSNVGDLLSIINKRLKEYFSHDDFQLGHSFFLRKKNQNDLFYLTELDFLYILHFEIIPMITEFNNGDGSIANTLLGQGLLEADEHSITDALQSFVEST